MKSLLLLGGTDNTDHDDLRRAAAADTRAVEAWSTLKGAAEGDEIWFYFPAPISAVVASGRATADAVPGADWPYVMPIGDLHWFGESVTLDELRVQFPDWGWAQTARGRTYLSESVASYLRDRRNLGSVSPTWSEKCIYTIVSRDRLDAAALEGTAFVGSEARPWTSGLRILQDAKNANQQVPVLLGDAKDCSRLLYWGELTNVDVEGKSTRYVVDRLRPIPGRRSPQELILASTGEAIAPGFIRPYAICRTPAFMFDRSELPELYPGEGPSEGTLIEGATMQVTVNAYERNREARRACISHYGPRCYVCSFDFAATYGARGEGFIEVHHVVPMSEVPGQRLVDPIRDLRPLCSNCHAMVHRSRPALHVDQLAALMANGTLAQGVTRAT